MRTWQVAGGVIEGPTGVLLVQNRRRDGRLDWSTPGGVVDRGETVIEGLTREVAEETGLVVAAWQGPIYEIEAEAPDLGWLLKVEVHVATDVAGELVVDDPDGIVVDACYVAPDLCGGHLAHSPLWVRDPLHAWLGERWDGNRSFRYRIDGTDPRDLRVSALH
ncbi:NUDIX hydrolase [Aquihabitans sp. G128]|uniref:NUDIX hydrolase n=1 Tax=Aquihabitans sp. G128 TaxID=2849779 RepID=UPI001C21B526|nr:NUDIX hydrolase [Aquihabitans sp. G128]QXC62289.1 NUDIX hydrolase [Aquihabitans sp. G128]